MSAECITVDNDVQKSPLNEERTRLSGQALQVAQSKLNRTH